MLKSRKSWSIVMAICLCMALMAPIFVAPPAALAASTNTVEQSLTAGQAASANLGVVKVTVSNDSLGLAVGSQLTVSFPSEVLDTLNDNRTGAGGGAGTAPAVRDVAGATYTGPTGVEVVVPNVAATGNAFTTNDITTGNVTNSKFTITIATVNGNASGDGVFYIYFYGLDTSNFAGDFLVSLVGNPGGVFSTSPSLTVGTVKKDAGTQTFPKSKVNVTGVGGATNGALNTITIFENAADAMDATPVELKILTKGYTWDITNFVALVYDWGFCTTPATAVVPFGFGGTTHTRTAVTDTLTITGIVANAPAPAVPAQAGQVHLSGLALNIDDSVARVGQDVEVRIKGGGVTEQTFTVAKYCDFEAQVLENTTTEIMAGREEQRIGEFFIEELAPGTLVQDRIITFELPEGYEWDNNTAFGESNYEVVNSSTITLGNPRYPDAVGNNLGRVMKLEVTADSSAATNGAKIKFKKLEVMVSPAAKGDLTLEISGKAGVDGTVKVATTVPIVSIEANPVDVVLGIQDQKVGDVILTETAANALVDRRDRTVDQRTIVLQLDEDFAFAKVPTVEVLEGDMILDLQSVRISGDRDNGGRLHIPIKAGSLKQAAKIKISDIYVTANRNAPVGSVKIKVAKARSAVNATNECLTGIAAPAYAFQDDSAGNAVLANNLTVPPSENIGATTGEFTISSNVYKVNGMVKVMDAAPYIKNNRTYVPVRYLGYALGLTDDQIVWDAGSQKATLTKGDTVVELTIGSTTITVNGEAQTMDVAPEMSNNRTMLPARFVAEAFGAKVGWDAVNRAVVIEN